MIESSTKTGKEKGFKMGSLRPNRYAGSRISVTRVINHLRRTDKKTRDAIQKLDKQLNAFSKKPDFQKIRTVYNMYSMLDMMNGLAVKWYPRFEGQLPEKVRPTSVIAKKIPGGVEVNTDRTLSLRSLMVAFGAHAAPLVKYALKHNLTEDMKFFVVPGNNVKDHRTCHVISVDHGSKCSLGNVPMLPIATAVALENGIVKLAGVEDIVFTNPNTSATFEFFKYCYPNSMKKD